MLAQTPPILDDLADVGGVTGWDVAAAVAIPGSIGAAMLVRRFGMKWLISVEGPPDPAGVAIVRAASYLLVVVGIVLALPLLGFSAQPGLILIVIVGVLLYVSGRPLVEDFTAGIILRTPVPFTIGDLIRHDDVLGAVMETDGRATVILTPDGETVRATNSAMLRDPIVNLSRNKARRTTVDVGVPYRTDLDRAVSVTQEANSHLDTLLSDPKPIVAVSAYRDSSIRIHVMFWHAPTIRDEIAARDEVMRSTDRALAESHIVVAFPQRDVWLRTRDDTQPDGGV